MPIDQELNQLWVYLAASPLLNLMITIAAFLFSSWLNRRVGGTALLHPVIVAIALLIIFLSLSGTSYDTYFEGAQFIHFLLGPATVALAVPLYDHLERVKQLFWPIAIACTTGILTAALSVIAVTLLLGGSRETMLSLVPKSVTSPIAMGIAEKLGGYPSLAAGLVLITGALGCLIAAPLFRLLKIKDESVQGFSLGLSAHGIGTAYAFGISTVAGAFSGLAMGVTGMASAFILPAIVKVLGL